MPDPVEFTVRLFAAAKQAIGADAAQIPLVPPYTISRLRAELITHYPQIAPLVQQSRIAVNADYAAPDRIISPAEEIALIPPVSGG